VPFADINRVRVGQKAVIQTPEGAEVLGTVRKVAPTVDAATRNALVWVDLPAGSALALRPGMFVRGQLRLSAQNVLTLPASAVLLRDGLDVVMQVASAPDGKATGTARVSQTRVQVVGRQADRVAVSGLEAQARVVERGAAFLADGDTVRVVSGLEK
jgi:HlyD family secretion protein